MVFMSLWYNAYFQIGVPVYCMAINARRYQLVCGCNGGIRVYALDESKLVVIINPIALRMAKTLWSFGCFECSRVKAVRKMDFYDSFNSISVLPS